MPRHTDWNETVSIDVEARAADRLFDVRDYLSDILEGSVGAAAEPGDEDRPLDGEYDHHDPTLSDAIEWLDRIRRVRGYLRSEHRSRGRIEGLVHAFDHLAVDYDPDLWAHVQETPAVYVIYSSSAHAWQGEHDEERDRTHLDDAADPRDLSLVVSEDGTVMLGGMEPTFIRAEDLPDELDLVDRVIGYQEQAREYARDHEEKLYGELPNVDVDDQEGED